jgi:RimJ/RimL family protein N-acetyltransferase
MENEESKPVLTTPRLLIRRWRQSDLEPFAAMNADPRVMEYFPKMSTREESDAGVQRAEAHCDRLGFCFWAVEAIGVSPFIGFTGLSTPNFEAPFNPCVEVGWRLAVQYWGKGYATEAARAAIDFGFKNVGLSEIVAYTAAENFRSRAVMTRLGMQYNPDDDFFYPHLPPEHRLSPHVVYRIKRG